MSKYGPTSQLTGTTHVWGDYYTRTVKDVLAGKGTGPNIWGGFKEGMIKLAPLNTAVPADVQKLVKDRGRDEGRQVHALPGPRPRPGRLRQGGQGPGHGRQGHQRHQLLRAGRGFPCPSSRARASNPRGAPAPPFSVAMAPAAADRIQAP